MFEAMARAMNPSAGDVVLLEGADLRIRSIELPAGLCTIITEAPFCLYAHMLSHATLQWLQQGLGVVFAPRMVMARTAGFGLQLRVPQRTPLLLVELVQRPSNAEDLCARAPSFDPALEHWCSFLMSQAQPSVPAALAPALHSLLLHALDPPEAAVRTSLDQLMRFVDERLGFDLSVEDLARFQGCSTSQLLRWLKREAGLTPVALIAQRRLERARRLLAQTELGLAEIALSCGFSSQSHFGNVFRKSLGLTPGQYREQCQKSS